MRYDRCRKLLGEDFERLQKAKILILGVGGVGGHALDCLYRTGISDITIVDFDVYDESNKNRQIGSCAVGEKKVEHLAALYPGITPIYKKIDIEWIDNFDFDSFDLILDAIDDIKPKVHLIQKHYKKMITTTGSAKRLDPSKIEYISLWKTHGDPFAKKIRDELKKKRFSKNIKVVFSSEQPRCKELGSFIGVTGSFGLKMCSVAIEKLLGKQ